MSEYDEVDEQFEEEEFEGFSFEEDETPQEITDEDIINMSDEEFKIYLDTSPFHYRWANYLGMTLGFCSNIGSIVYNSFWILFYKFLSSQIYRYIHIAIMIIGALLYWITMFGQEDVQILDGEDEHVIFHLPSI